MRWVVEETDSAAEERLRAELGLSAFLARLLVLRGISGPVEAEAFLRPTLRQGLRSPRLFREMPAAVDRLLGAVERRERIAIYGDYDVDGITGTSQLLLFLRGLGADPETFVPHRVREGYGLRAGPLRELAGRGTRLLVTVDCGAAAHEEIALARELGMDVVVCDHHQAPETRPPATAVLNPTVADSGFPFAGLSAAGVVFYLLMGCRMRLRENGDEGPDLKQFLDLVALGTVADLVPLVEENRVLVRHGLAELGRGHRIGLRALVEVAGVGRPSAEALAFQLCPRLNASGRLADAASAVALLVAEAKEEASDLAALLDRHNRDRREIETGILSEALAQAEGLPDLEERRTLVLSAEGWHPGVVGIVASRLVERFHRPVVLLTREGDTCRGSARGIRGVHLYRALAGCRDLLDAFGGHAMAAGLTLRSERLEAFAARFEATVREATSPTHFEPVRRVDGRLQLREIDGRALADLAELEPHGAGNPRPSFLAREVEVAECRVVGQDHLRLRLRDPEARRLVPAIAFRMADRDISRGARVDLVYRLEPNDRSGSEEVELVVRDILPSA